MRSAVSPLPPYKPLICVQSSQQSHLGHLLNPNRKVPGPLMPVDYSCARDYVQFLEMMHVLAPAFILA